MTGTRDLPAALGAREPLRARAVGFLVGVVAAWIPLAAVAGTGSAWPGLVALAALWVALVRAIRGSSAMAWGLLAGAVSSVLVLRLLWAAADDGRCAYEDAAGRAVVTDCGGPPPSR